MRFVLPRTTALSAAQHLITRLSSLRVHRRWPAWVGTLALMLALPTAHATHGNGGRAVIYDGSLDPSAARTALLTDGYDWYCFAGTPGAAASITVARTSGALLPNLELWSGVVANGTPFPYTGLTEYTAARTSNNTLSSISVNAVLPASASGKYSVVVSTWLGETGGYSIALTGGTATVCSAEAVVVPTVAVPAVSSGWVLALLAALLAVGAVGRQTVSTRKKL